MKTIEKRVVAISSKLVAEQKKKSRKPLVWYAPHMVDNGNIQKSII